MAISLGILTQHFQTNPVVSHEYPLTLRDSNMACGNILTSALWESHAVPADSAGKCRSSQTKSWERNTNINGGQWFRVESKQIGNLSNTNWVSKQKKNGGIITTYLDIPITT